MMIDKNKYQKLRDESVTVQLQMTTILACFEGYLGQYEGVCSEIINTTHEAGKLKQPRSEKRKLEKKRIKELNKLNSDVKRIKGVIREFTSTFDKEAKDPQTGESNNIKESLIDKFSDFFHQHLDIKDGYVSII